MEIWYDVKNQTFFTKLKIKPFHRHQDFRTTDIDCHTYVRIQKISFIATIFPKLTQRVLSLFTLSIHFNPSSIDGEWKKSQIKRGSAHFGASTYVVAAEWIWTKIISKNRFVNVLSKFLIMVIQDDDKAWF